MSNKSRAGLVATVLIGLLVISGAVMAAEVLLEAETEIEAQAETESETEAVEAESEGEAGAEAEADTQFDFGYDDANRYLVFSITSTEDETSECDLDTDDENGAPLTYTVGEDGEIQVTTESEGCELHAIDVTGPAGQINHGMFMKAFNEYLNDAELEYGRGCLVSQLAKSGIGIDNQIRPGETEGEFEVTATGSVDFSTALANCEHGPDDDEEEEIESEDEGRGNGRGKGKGKPDWAGPPPWAGKGR